MISLELDILISETCFTLCTFKTNDINVKPVFSGNMNQKYILLTKIWYLICFDLNCFYPLRLASS